MILNGHNFNIYINVCFIQASNKRLHTMPDWATRWISLYFTLYEFEGSAVGTDNSRDSCGSGDAFYITPLFQDGVEPEEGSDISLASACFRKSEKKQQKQINIKR